MSAARRILLLRAPTAAAEDLAAIAESLAAEGATVVSRDLRGDYDALLDEVAAADVVLCWR